MKYVGSKNKYSKELLPIILENRQSDQWYVEPFAGGFNLIDKVKGNRLANDNNYYLIELFKAIQKGWIPPDIITEEEYSNIKNNKDNFEPYLVGFVGIICSYSGKWFGGYARGNNEKGKHRNYTNEGKRNLLKQAKNIQGIVITNMDYKDLEIPDNSIIYCDPPYRKTTNAYTNKFNHDEFWSWVRKMVKIGHQVFISEYSAPVDFISIWSKEVNNTLVKNTGAKQGIEKLWISKASQI